MALPHNDEAPIRNVSRADVELTVATLKQFIKRSMWLGKTNRYLKNVVNRLKIDHPLSAHYQRNLAQYIAASSILHANDGWCYLGRAVSALMNGDPHRSLHLAYYAELRAAMALLASEGVGIFNKKHYVLNGPNMATRLSSSQGTHRIAWDALEFWMNNLRQALYSQG